MPAKNMTAANGLTDHVTFQFRHSVDTLEKNNMVIRAMPYHRFFRPPGPCVSSVI
jgi:hypothetical protein